LLLQTVKQVGQFATLTFHVHRLARCDGNCLCVCHSRGHFQSPLFLNRFFGVLFIGYAGLPVWTRECDKPDCFNQYSRTLQVSCTFPWWLLRKTVDFVAAWTYNNEPHFGLKVRNRIQTSENSITCLLATETSGASKNCSENAKLLPTTCLLGQASQFYM
jgi:hypothetical protein